MNNNCPRCGAPSDDDQRLGGLCPACLLAEAADPDDPTRPAGFMPPELAALAPLFPDLELKRLISRGGMAAVYEARQVRLDRRVALKILAPNLSRDPAFVERFAREARTLAALDHPGIVKVHDTGQAGEFAYLLLEYVDGVDLRQLAARQRLSPREALAIVPQICDALQYAHDHGVVHRDIKPDNVLIDRQGRIKVADFGLAKLLSRPALDIALTATHTALGTPHYMAPEQFERPETVDHRADIYALGVVLYELLTGELPLGRFQAPSARVDLDVRLDEIVLKALEKQPERRYQQAREVSDAIRTVDGARAAVKIAPARIRWYVWPALVATSAIGLILTGLAWGWGLAGVFIVASLSGAAVFLSSLPVRLGSPALAGDWQDSSWRRRLGSLVFTSVLFGLAITCLLVPQVYIEQVQRYDALWPNDMPSVEQWHPLLTMTAGRISPESIQLLGDGEWTVSLHSDRPAWVLLCVGFGLLIVAASSCLNSGRHEETWNDYGSPIVLVVIFVLGGLALSFVPTLFGTTLGAGRDTVFKVAVPLEDIRQRLEAWGEAEQYVSRDVLVGILVEGDQQRARVRSRVWLAGSIHDRWRVRFGKLVTHQPMLRIDLLGIEDADDPLTIVRVAGPVLDRNRDDPAILEATVDSLRQFLTVGQPSARPSDGLTGSWLGGRNAPRLLDAI